MNISKRTNNRLIFNLKCLSREIIPGIFFRHNFKQKLSKIEASLTDDQLERLEFYCQPNALDELPIGTPNLANIPRTRSTYYCDLTKFTRYFDQKLKIQTNFSDIRDMAMVPEQGLTILKSRPSDANNSRAVLFKLNQVRLNFCPRDRVEFADKLDGAVWRGAAHTSQRRQATVDFKDHAWIDIGHTSAEEEGVEKPRLTIAEQLRSKFVISLQGHDVATNLHWAMSSNSVCVMPRPQNEGWSMESRMIPDVHYIHVNNDLSDLEEKLTYFRKHPREAEEISRNGQKYISQFYDLRSESALQIMVLYRYFQQTGQMA